MLISSVADTGRQEEPDRVLEVNHGAGPLHAMENIFPVLPVNLCSDSWDATDWHGLPLPAVGAADSSHPGGVILSAQCLPGVKAVSPSRLRMS